MTLCTGTGKPVGSGSCCQVCEKSFGFPHPAGLVVGMPAPEHDEPYNQYADETPSLDEAGLAALVIRAKHEILDDMGRAINHNGDRMPLTVGIPKEAQRRGHPEGGYSELHDFVDANEYGGATEEGNTLTLGDVIAMQNAIQPWLTSGQALADALVHLTINRRAKEGDVVVSKSGRLYRVESVHHDGYDGPVAYFGVSSLEDGLPNALRPDEVHTVGRKLAREFDTE